MARKVKIKKRVPVTPRFVVVLTREVSRHASEENAKRASRGVKLGRNEKICVIELGDGR